jgi:hypothetical protein
MQFSVDAILNGPLEIDFKFAKSILAGVLGIDLTRECELVSASAALVLALAKLLADLKVDRDHIQAILRYFKSELIATSDHAAGLSRGSKAGPPALVLGDNRYASVVPITARAYDYREDNELESAPSPLFLFSIDLIKVFAILKGSQLRHQRHQTAEE